jgi:hypothetical protein
VLATTNRLLLKLNSHAAGVQFVQLLAPRAAPINVAYAGNSSVELLRLERRLAVDVRVVDERMQVALDYLHHRRVREAVASSPNSQQDTRRTARPGRAVRDGARGSARGRPRLPEPRGIAGPVMAPGGARITATVSPIGKRVARSPSASTNIAARMGAGAAKPLPAMAPPLPSRQSPDAWV